MDLMRKTFLIWSVVTALVVGVSVVFVVWFNGGSKWSGADEVSLLKPNELELVQRGGEVYWQYCASCHGAGLQGEEDWQSPNADGTLKAPPHNEAGHTWHHADELLFRITKYGTAVAINDPKFQSNMPAFESDLSDDDIVAVLSFIKAQWPEEIQAAHDELNQRSFDQR